MNKKSLLVGALALYLLAVILWWKVHFARQAGGTHGEDYVSTTASQPLASNSNQKSNQAIEQKMKERDEEVRQIFQTKIDFFGRVVDESGKPVEGAKTSYSVSSDRWEGSPTLAGPSTDSDGQFSITGKHGPRLTVWVSHPNYLPDLTRRQFTYAGPVNGNAPAPPNDGPAIIVLHRKGQIEPLIHYQLIKAQLPIDGKSIMVDLRKGVVGSGNESIALSLHSAGNTLTLNHFHPFDWDLRIQIPNGGVVERTDQFRSQAPVEGYQPEIFYSKPASLPREEWNSRFDNEFFVALPSGVYARIHVHIVATSGACRIESFLNPVGSRNLEYDPAKQIKTP